MARLADLTPEEVASGSPTITPGDMAGYLAQVPAWNVVDRDGMRHLERVFPFPDFAAALAFTNRVGALAEQYGHHPAITTEWGKVTVAWWTHSVGGLHLNDFIMAAKTDELVRGG